MTELEKIVAHRGYVDEGLVLAAQKAQTVGGRLPEPASSREREDRDFDLGEMIVPWDVGAANL